VKRLQPMPVADSITQPGRLIYLHQGDLKPTRSEDFAQKVINCKRVNFGLGLSPTETLRGGIKSDADLISRINDYVGPQILPFDEMWFEGTWPEDTPRKEHIEAFAVRAVSHGTYNEETMQPVRSTTFYLFGLTKRGIILRHQAVATLCIDKVGRVNDLFVASYNEAIKGFDGEVNQDVFLWTLGMAMPAMRAIGLMNCRNVKLSEHQQLPRTTKKQRRQRRPGLSYSTIVLPGGSPASGSGQVDGSAALHHVRGHFKTFTAERPLMGKNVGTYWWGWQVRGNQDNGVVVSDYKLA
jgi:hypothetical protein